VLNTRLVPQHGVRVAVRIGIHTGLVVIGEMGGANRQEHLALGETPNVAARLQGMAAPDTIAISAATCQLVQGYFTCQALGPHALKGLSTPVPVYRVLGASAAQSRLDIAGATGLTPLVGRDAEVALLLERWAQSQNGMGQVVLLRGEAGIGKSRLVEVLGERVRSEGATRIMFRCSSYHQQSALYPVLDHLQRFLQWQRDDSPEAKFDTLERVLRTYRLPLEDVVPLFATLLSVPLPARCPPLNLTPQRQRQKTHEALVAWLLEEAERHPVLAVWEDLHWADPSTLDVLSLVLDQVPTARMLTLFTCRPEFRPPWATHASVTQVILTRLGRTQVDAMITSLTGGKALPPEVVEQVVAKTDGVPLFVEELVKMILESGLVREEDNQYVLTGPLPPLAIPSTLHDSLMARLDRLSAARTLIQLGAVLGREFPYTLLRAVAPVDEMTFQRGLAQLVDAELLYQRGLPPHSRYIFKHALIQDTAYHSLLKSTRQQYHQRIAQVLTTQFAEITEIQPELAAHHYTEAGLHARAIEYWHKAGQGAIRRSANVEALAHLQHGLDVLRHLPETPERTQLELTLLLPLGTVLMSTKGYGDPEVEQAYARARHLCAQGGTASSLFPVLRGLCLFYAVRVEFQTARALGEQLLSIAQRQHDPLLLVEAHRALGVISFWTAEMTVAMHHFEQGVHWYTPQQHAALVALYGHDAGVACLAWSGWALWWLGYPEQALARHAAALSLARQHAHPFTLAFALNWATWLHHFRRDGVATQAAAEAVIALATEQGFTMWRAHGAFLRGWSWSVQGQAAGLAEMRQGLAAYQATGQRLMISYGLGLLAATSGQAWGTAAEAQRLTEALAVVSQTGERWAEAELYRLQGQLLLQQAVPDEQHSAICFQHALALARSQQAKSFELRAATSLARLWQCRGKRQEAYDLLAPVYHWFTEGFDTADVQEAKALLDALTENQG
jgi:predicted ATPase